MNLRELWARAQRWYAGHNTRDRRILAGVAVAVVVSLLYVGVAEPIIHYRRRVADEIGEGHEQLERSARFVAAGDGLRAERDDLKQRLDEARKRLLPGDSGTLGAAALQERANSTAVEKGITVQSTQVMKEEVAEPFHKVSIRLTLSGELKPFVELLSGLEYGPQQLTVPFLEITRRGAVAGQKGPRTLAATLELSGYLLGEAAKPAEAEAAEGEAEAAVPPPEGETSENPAAKAPAEGQPEAPAATETPTPPANPPGPPAAEAPQPPPEAPKTAEGTEHPAAAPPATVPPAVAPAPAAPAPAPPTTAAPPQPGAG
ncbi:MAG TPA: type II secretion system protein GspM [Candidatus Binatia bacterium]|nr:type II secretion system protein GspM [Candidatus Binatia bacterium]